MQTRDQASTPGDSADDAAVIASRREAWRRYPFGAGRGLRSGLFWAAVLLMAVGVRVVYDNPGSFIDEYYHLLAAERQMDVGDGRLSQRAPEAYTRAAWFTDQVVMFQRAFGRGMDAARAVSVVWGVVLVGVMFGWVRAAAGSWASVDVETGRRRSWIGSLRFWAPLLTAVLCAWSLELVSFSNLVRFYMMHTALVAAAATGLWVAVSPRTTRGFWALAGPEVVEAPRGVFKRVAAGACCVVALAVAYTLQPSTVFVVAGMSVWVLAALVAWWVGPWWDRPSTRRLGGVLLAALAATGVVLLVVSAATGWLQDQWAMYRTPFPWSEATADDIGFYLRHLVDRFGWLAMGFPVAAVAALLVRRWAAGLMLCVLAAVVLGHSFGALKAERYILHAVPMFLGVWGLALGWLIAGLIRVGLAAADAASERFTGASAFRGVLVACVVTAFALPLAYALYRSPSFYLTQRIVAAELADDPAAHAADPFRYTRWREVAPVLRPLASEAALVVSSASYPTAYHLHRHDVGLSVSQVADGRRYRDRLGGGTVGAAGSESVGLVDWRLGTPVIATVAELEAVLASVPSALVVVEAIHWGQSWAVTPEVAAFIQARGRRVSLPTDSGVYAFLIEADGRETASDTQVRER